MDITSQELKTMKTKQLRRIIREAITEVLAEVGQTPGHGAVKVKKGDIASIKKYTAQGIDVEEDPTMKEGDIDEAIGNKLSDENIDLSKFSEKLTAILTFIKENPGVTEKQIADKFGFATQQPVNNLMSKLRSQGIITRLDKTGQVIAPKSPSAPGEEQPEPVTGPEAMFIGSGDPLAQYFDGEPNASGEEDFNADEEPTTGDIESPKEPLSTMSSDKEKAAGFTLDDSNARLIQSIIQNYSTLKKKIKGGGGEPGGLSGSDMMQAIKSSRAAAEVKFPQKFQQLVDRIKEQEPSVQKAILDSLTTKFASVKLPSLAKAVAKDLNIDAKIPSTPIPEEEPEEEEPLEEAFDAYEIKKLQFYAGITK